jgi:hypothetical protein
MMDFDPADRFSVDAVRNYDGGDPRDGKASKGLGKVARQVAAQYRRDTLSPVMVAGVLRMVDFGILLVAGLAITAVYIGTSVHLYWHYPIIVAAGSVGAVLAWELADAYQVPAMLRPARHLGRMLLFWVAVFAGLAVAGFFLKISEDYSRLLFGGWFAVGFALVAVNRLVVARMLRRWARNGRMERRALIVGGGKAAEALIRSLEQQPDNDIRICGIFDDRDDRRSPPIVAGYPKLGNISELIDFARIARIDMLIVSLPITAESRVLSLLKKLWVLPVDIRLSAHSNQLQFRPRAYSFIGSVPLLDIFDKPINDWDSVAKRAFDIVFSLFGIVVFSPIMLATAIAIKLDSKGRSCSSRSGTASTTRRSRSSSSGPCTRTAPTRPQSRP